MKNSSLYLKGSILFLSAVWIGMIVAVAMEAVVRPKTPELLPEHRGLMFVITRTVFEVFQKIELIIGSILLFLAVRGRIHPIAIGLLIGVFAVCLIESYWLMPELAKRSVMVFNGLKLPPSNVHLLSVLSQGIKILFLLFVFVKEIQRGTSHLPLP